MADETPEESDYQSPIATAIARLSSALDELEQTADKHSAAKDPGEEMQRMGEDRAKLARDLDVEKARGDRLAQVNSEVSKRLVGVMETVRHVLDDDSSSKSPPETE
ncbi:MAG: DUF4164 family protein [Rhizobiaceae bacterium]